jgi:RNA polymerase sigma factor (sigma-70 family)
MANLFSGNVKVYNEEIFVDSVTGLGIDRVLKKIDPLLFKMAKSIYIQGYAVEDIKQELAVLAIEGIRSFDASKNVKLSTFLHIHLHNKIISKIRSQNKLSNNASSSIEDSSLPDACDCGSTIFMVETKGGEERRECVSCNKLYTKKLKNAKHEIPFSVMDEKVDQNEDGKLLFIDSVPRDNSVFGGNQDSEDEMEISSSIESICQDLDEKTAKIVRLVCLEDYSIKDAADEVGLSSWAANVRLKNLSKNKKIKDNLKIISCNSNKVIQIRCLKMKHLQYNNL